VRAWTRHTDSEQGVETSCYIHGNETNISIKGRGFLDHLNGNKFLKNKSAESNLISHIKGTA
jgi:hypothetical protein